MKQITTLLASACFLACGALLPMIDAETKVTQTMDLNAATPVVYPMSALPLDFQLSQAKQSYEDSVESKLYAELDTVIVTPAKQAKPKYKARKKQKKQHEPDSMSLQVKKDTLYVPSLYIIIPLKNLEESDDTLSIIGHDVV